MKTPKIEIGDLILITKRSVMDKKGNVHLINCSKRIERVEKVFHHGAIMTNYGDVWIPVKVGNHWQGAY